MNISERGLRLIEGFEGYSYTAYWDPWGKVWTVGYGETENVGPGTVQTRDQAQADLRNRLAREYEPHIAATGVSLNQNQWDAVTSFIWNLGVGVLSTGYDFGRLLRARDYRGAADAMLEYDHAGGVVLQGLSDRRRSERELFLRPAPPPRPLDPFRYLDAQERQAVQEFRRHPNPNSRQAARVAELRKVVWRAAVHGVLPGGERTTPGWHLYYRLERWHALAAVVPPV